MAQSNRGKPNQKWTQDMMDFVTIARERGMSYSEISASMNARFTGMKFTRNSVIGAAQRNGLDTTNGQTRKLNSTLAAKLKCFGLKRTKTPKKETTKMTNRDRMELRGSSAPEPIGPIDDFPDHEGCLWIETDPAAGPWRCCGHPRRIASPYCAHHHARCTSIEVKHRGSTVPLARQYVRS